MKKVKTEKGMGNSNLAKAYNAYHSNKKHKVEKEEERQCFGPKCIYSARSGAKPQRIIVVKCV